MAILLGAQRVEYPLRRSGDLLLRCFGGEHSSKGALADVPFICTIPQTPGNPSLLQDEVIQGRESQKHELGVGLGAQTAGCGNAVDPSDNGTEEVFGVHHGACLN